MDDYVDREEAENIIKEAIDDYLPTETLQEILDLIFGSEFIVIDSDGDNVDDEEEMD